MGRLSGSGPPAIQLVAERAQQALAEAGAFVRSHGVPLTVNDQPGRKWHLFADLPIDSTETCAISCAVAALLSIGDRPDSSLVTEAMQTLLPLQLPSGGWTSWVNNIDDVTEDPEEALIIDTYFALRALDMYGIAESEPFSRGIEWFRGVQDSAAGGWGFHPGGEPHVLPTSMAVAALSIRGRQNDPTVRDAVNRGVEWLLHHRGRNNEQGWRNRHGQPSSAAHTGWALRALTAAGYDRYSPPVVAAREWLLSHTKDRESIIDHYVTPGRTSGGLRRASRAITHISFPEGIIVHGLLSAGANLLDPRLLVAVEDLILAQEREGYWRCLHAPREQPIYAVMDACIALRLFVDVVQRHESILEVSERVQQHEATVAQLNTRVEALLAVSNTTLERITGVATTLEVVGRRLDEQQARWQDLTAEVGGIHAKMESLRRGLVLLNPVIWLTRLVIRWPVLAVLVVLQAVAYGLAAFTFPPGYRALSWVVGGLLTLVTAITFWAQTRVSTHSAALSPSPHVKEST